MQGAAEYCALLLEEGEDAFLMKSHNIIASVVYVCMTE
jgi:hypothetical protein